MKILSDLHLEVNPDFQITNDNNDSVLILAGDICTANSFVGRSDYYSKDTFLKFFYDCSKLFDTVIYVMGNHEHYGGDIQDTAGILRSVFPANFYLLDNESIIIDDIHYYGGTCWTDLSDPLAAEEAKRRMNDYRRITKSVDGGLYYLKPADTTALHKQFLANMPDSCDVIISHHLPSFRSIDPRYIEFTLLNKAFATELLGNGYGGMPELWVHGHTHCSKDYFLGGTRVVCNPRGYHNENKEFIQ